MKKMNMGLKSHRGFTLIEVMIVVAIIAILAAISIPSYSEYLLRSKRAMGKAVLMDIANKQEQFFLSNKSYTTTLTNLGAGGGYIDTQGRLIASSADAIYLVTIGAAAGGTISTTYLITAVPQGGQTKDTKCGTLTLDNTGNKTKSGTDTVANCWGK